jgi:hypothetical protein
MRDTPSPTALSAGNHAQKAEGDPMSMGIMRMGNGTNTVGEAER